jgi:hypothetical protein
MFRMILTTRADYITLSKRSLPLHRAFRTVIQPAHQRMHIHTIFYIKTFKIAPACFDPTIIFRELHCSLLNSPINFLILTRCCGSMSYCVSRTVLRVRLTVFVCVCVCVFVCVCVWCVMLRETVSRNITHSTELI